MEKRPLFTPAELKAWQPAESSVAVSTERVRGAETALHWHVKVDYQTGEPKYPIGWPRVGRTVPAGAERDWSEWDFLHAWIFVATDRSALPAVAAGLGLHTPDRTGAYQRTLSELKAGEWTEIKIPLTQIPRHHDVRQVQFHIAESNYRDGDTLDFFISDLSLVRYAEPVLLDFAPESAVVWAGAKRLPVTLRVAGVAKGRSTGLDVSLRRENREVWRAAVFAVRGEQTLALELGTTPLPPGRYEVRASLAGKPDVLVRELRVVESPWP